MIKKIDNLTKHLYGQLFVACILGAVQVFAFAPFEQWWVIYPTFVGFFLLQKQLQKSTRRYFLVSFIFSISSLIATLCWIYVSMDLYGGMPKIVSALLIVLLCAYLAIYPSLALWASTRLSGVSDTQRYLLLIPVFWLISDWFRGYVLTGFPWAYLGYSHADTPLVGFAPVLGVQGITLAVMVICGALTLLIQKQKIGLSLSVISALLISGFILQQQQYTIAQPSINVSLVQGNIDQNEKWKKEQLSPSLQKYSALSETGLDDQTELIIWPESAIAALDVNVQAFLQPLSADLAAKNKTLMTGIIGYESKTDSYYNSIVTLGKLPNQQLPQRQGYSLQSENRYQKHHLLPIGEFVPFEKLLRPLAPYFNLPMSSFQRGTQLQNNLQTEQVSIAAAICYEIAFPELLRKNIGEKTGVLLTVSNDAWFGNSIGPDQHLQIARMRAIEFARPLLRSTNNGVTAIFDASGNELGRLPVNVAAVLSKKIQPTFGQTPYQYAGSYPLYLYCLLVLLGLFLSSKYKKHKTKS
ncbi:apolipoprotein N-acyltransferase [Psychromonas ingrahamii 37]|uniref:Apolipoprotein N-acyltransferase n=1 Tax=Psychromonas ingrahamii (strain DSM 17664 / CCUG 51855 / 37) TaxID=357804 RepID=A1SSC0_PSYIN|nr:apolipoprotein N-acyltransferase [Psychromonas ingrahamii 37]